MSSSTGLRRSRGRVRVVDPRTLGSIVAGLAIGAVITGIAFADAGNPPTGGYVSMAAVKLFDGSIGASKTVSPVGIGGATTVPTNATAVRLSITIKDTKSGTLNVYPAGDPTAAGATAIAFGAGTSAPHTIDETVGTKSEITFSNTSAGAATITSNITGYSTQITAGNVASDGGSAGQVLTNTGTGASWLAGSLSVLSGTGLSGGGLVSLGSSTTLGVAAGGIGTTQLADGAVTDTKVASANKDGAANVPSMRTLGTGSQQAMAGDARPGGPPTGAAGGSLTGTYPNPQLANGSVGAAQLAPGVLGSGPYYLGEVSIQNGQDLSMDVFNPNSSAVHVTFTVMGAAGYTTSSSSLQTIPAGTNQGFTFFCTAVFCTGTPAIVVQEGLQIVPSAEVPLAGATNETVPIGAGGFTQLH